MPVIRRSASPSRIAGVLDQGLWSFNNLLLSLLVARHSTIREFAMFALAMGICWLSVGAGRALVGEPGLVAAGADGRRTVSARLCAGAAIGVVSAAAFWACAAVVGGPVFALLGACILPILLQDSLRYVFFSLFQPWRACAADAVWVVAHLVAVPASVEWLMPAGPQAWVAAWTSGAVIAVVAGLWWLRPAWSPVEARLWVRRTRRVAGASCRTS